MIAFLGATRDSGQQNSSSPACLAGASPSTGIQLQPGSSALQPGQCGTKVGAVSHEPYPGEWSPHSAINCLQSVDDQCAELIFESGVTKTVQKTRKNNTVVRVGREVLAFFVPEARRKKYLGK